MHKSTKKRSPSAKRQTPKLMLVSEKLLQPPPWKAVTPISRRVRWGVVAAQAELDVTVNALLYAQCMGYSTTLVASWAYAVRLKRVAIYFVSPTQSTTISSTVEWNAGGTGFLLDNVSVAQANCSTTELACLETRPPTDSLSSWYQGGATAGTNVIFSFSAPAGAILEMDFDWVPNLTEASLGTLSATSAVIGVNYCRGISSNILALPPLNSVAP